MIIIEGQSQHITCKRVSSAAFHIARNLRYCNRCGWNDGVLQTLICLRSRLIDTDTDSRPIRGFKIADRRASELECLFYVFALRKPCTIWWVVLSTD